MFRGAALAALVLATGCEIDIDKRVEQGTCAIGSGSACLAAMNTDGTFMSSFTWIHDNILTKNCTGSSCHETDSSSDAKKTPYLALDEAYSSLVNKASNVYSGQMIVVPNHPEQSVLMLMTQEIAVAEFDPPTLQVPPSRSGTEIGFMPQANGTLCCQKLDALKAWINAGAPNI
jgi:hypothetical protein